MMESGVRRRLATQATKVGLTPGARPGRRALQLYGEARLAAFDHLAALQLVIDDAQDLAQAIVEGRDLYAAEIHDLARRIAEELFWRAKSLEALRLRLEPMPAHREKAAS